MSRSRASRSRAIMMSRRSRTDRWHTLLTRVMLLAMTRTVVTTISWSDDELLKESGYQANYRRRPTALLTLLRGDADEQFIMLASRLGWVDELIGHAAAGLSSAVEAARPANARASILSLAFRTVACGCGCPDFFFIF